jgi:X-Pro dipeptidyl-peptidase
MGGFRTLVKAVSCSVLLLLAGAPAARADTQAFLLRDGVSQPIYSYEKAVRETVWVETGQDLDRDAHVDRVAADIIRPAEPAARGLRVPVIMDVSPYFERIGRGNEAQTKTYLPDGTPSRFPLFYDNYFVPRGYAVVLVDVGGTNRSHGCFDDVASGLGVVNWLNGRANGFSAVEGGQRVRAGWSNGSVGAIGKSQDGTAANGMAATGIDGLKTIVPIASVSSYYKVNNSDGAWFGDFGSGPPLYNPRAVELCKPFEAEQDRLAGKTGDYNRYWLSRDYVAHADKVRASVFAIHGFQDLNVRPAQFGPWWDALSRYNVPRKAWLHEAAHVDPFDLQRPEFVATLHRWFDRWLLGVRNGVEREPMVHLQHGTGGWTDEPRWPAATQRQTLWPANGKLTASRPLQGTATLKDDPSQSQHDWAANPDQPSSARVLFSTEPAKTPTRLSGTPSVTVTLRSDKPMARVGALLVDYGPATVLNTDYPSLGIRNLTTRSCWGVSTPADNSCFLDTEAATHDVDKLILAYGWADLGHHRTLWRGEPLTPGKPYTMTFDLGSLDHVVPAGHKVALVIGGTDWDWFTAPSPEPTLTFDLPRTSVSLPVAGRGLT